MPLHHRPYEQTICSVIGYPMAAIHDSCKSATTGIPASIFSFRDRGLEAGPELVDLRYFQSVSRGLGRFGSMSGTSDRVFCP